MANEQLLWLAIHVQNFPVFQDELYASSHFLAERFLLVLIALGYMQLASTSLTDCATAVFEF